jgi:hypothetical protein
MDRCGTHGTLLTDRACPQCEKSMDKCNSCGGYPGDCFATKCIYQLEGERIR